MGALYATFKAKLKEAIRQCPDRMNYPELYITLFERTKLPRYTVPDAARRLDIDLRLVESFLRQQVQTTGKQTIAYWKEYVEQHFDECINEVLYVDPQETEANSSDVDDQDDDDGYDETEEFRTCTTSFQTIIKKDLEEEVRHRIEETILNCIRDTTNYTSDFSIQVLKMALVFNTHTFTLRNNTVILEEAQGANLGHVIPIEYLDDAMRVPRPFDAACFRNQAFKKDFDLLFQTGHFNIINSSLYGTKGPTDANLNKHSVHRLISDAIGLAPTEAYHHLPSHVTKMARLQYTTNVKNMWSDKTIINKLLKRLIKCLLCIHLRPTDEKQLQERRLQPRQAAPRSSNSNQGMSFSHKTRNGRRRVINNEKKNLERCKRLNKVDKAARCEERLTMYADVMERERRQKALRRQASSSLEEGVSEDEEDALVADEPESEKTNDTSKRRITQMLNQIRSNLFQNTPLSRSTVGSKIENLSDSEFDAMSIIAGFIKPYIPAQVDYAKLQYQLPFLLMANEILRYMGRSSQCLQILPLVKPTTLHTFLIDAKTLYALFCASTLQQPMILFNFQNEPIQEGMVDSYKDAVLSAFFDIAHLKRLCERHGNQFARRLHIFPALTTVRIYDTVPRLVQHQQPITATDGDPIDEDHHPDLQQQNDAVVRFQHELKDATARLETMLLMSPSVRQLKNDFRGGQASFKTVEDAKTTKRRLMLDVRDAKTNLQIARREVQRLKSMHKFPPTLPPNYQRYMIRQQPCLKKAEECFIDEDFDLQGAIFAGTDNGIVKTTETVYFDIERFLYHLRLFLHFHPSDQNGQPVGAPAMFMDLPATLTIGSKEIKQGSGMFDYMRSMNKKKTPGEQVLAIESTLSANSLFNCSTPNELEETAHLHQRHQQAIRSFYYSNIQCKERRQFEWRKERYYDRLASNERNSSGVKHPIMFIGDRGHGYGSCIKRHLRFGGHWREERHSRYTPTIITNEYNSSQTCLYCFNKLSHPTFAHNNAIKTTKGTFVCLNEDCPNAFVSVCRDQVSALAIGLAGLSQLLFGAAFPCFDEDTNPMNKTRFYEMATLFLREHA